MNKIRSVYTIEVNQFHESSQVPKRRLQPTAQVNWQQRKSFIYNLSGVTLHMRRDEHFKAGIASRSTKIEPMRAEIAVLINKKQETRLHAGGSL
jgi:hypothetical protein